MIKLEMGGIVEATSLLVETNTDFDLIMQIINSTEQVLLVNDTI